MISLKTLTGNNTPSNDNSLKGVDATNEYMVLEYIERGDLHQWICKATEDGVTFEDGVLWAIFKCREYCC